MNERRKLQSKKTEIIANPKEGGCVTNIKNVYGTHKLLLTFKDGDSMNLFAHHDDEQGLVLSNYEDVVSIVLQSTPLRVEVVDSGLTYLEVKPGTVEVIVTNCPRLVSISLPQSVTSLIVRGKSLLRKPVGFDIDCVVYMNENLKNKFYTKAILKL